MEMKIDVEMGMRIRVAKGSKSMRRSHIWQDLEICKISSGINIKFAAVQIERQLCFKEIPYEMISQKQH